MTGLAVRLLRHRPGTVLATLIALAAGVMILTSMSALVESALRTRPEAQRFAAADIVVAKRDITFTGKEFGGDTYQATLRLPESGTVPASLVEKIRGVPGVADVVTDQAVSGVVMAGGSRPIVGHSWAAAALAPYRVAVGNQPQADNEIVVDAGLAASAGGALQPGRQADVVVDGVSHRYTVSGILEQKAGGLFFTDRRAATLAPQAGQVDAIGVIVAGGADRAAVASAVDELAASVSAKAYAGDDKWKAERSDFVEARSLLIEVGAAFGGYVVMLIVFVVAGTVGLSIRTRRRDLALLRATAATPGQLRRMLMAEAGVLAGLASLIGVPAGLLASRWVADQLVTRGFVPADYPMAIGALAAPAAVLLIVILAVVAALVAARRVSGIRPAEALAEASVEPPRGGKVRFGFGLASLLGALTSSAVSVGAGGQAALAGALGMLYLFVLAVALLAPWINGIAAKLLAPVLRAVWGNSGYLASKNLAVNARGMATVVTALVLSVGFGGSVWFLQDNVERQTVEQVQTGTLAQYSVTSPAGLSKDAAERFRGIPGVDAVTAVRRTSVLVEILDGAEAVQAQSIDIANSGGTMDLRVRKGSLAEVGADSFAVSENRASWQGWKVGESVEVWLGDGTAKRLRVAAIYERGLGFGDVILDQATTGFPANQLLIHSTPDSAAAVAREVAAIPAASLVPTSELTAGIAKDLALSAWLNKLLIAVMVGYAALSAANTMIMAALARRREVAVLRLTGVTRRQVKRMVHAEQAGLLGTALVIGGSIAAVTLSAVVYALTGAPLPYVPALGWVTVIGATTALAMVTTIFPIALILRRSTVAQAGTKE